MAQAVRRISIERGHDPEEFVLVPFGGAAGQHACLVADQLGIKKILIDPLAGVLSARGIGSAAVSQLLRRTVERRLTDRIIGDIETGFEELERQLEHRFSDDVPELDFTRRLYLKYEGTDTSAVVPFAECSAMESALADFHRKRFGFDPVDHDIIVEAIELEAVLQGHEPTPEISNQGGSGGEAEPVMMDDVWLDGQWRKTPFYRRTDLRLEQQVTGPAVIVEDNATTIVEPGWTAQAIRHADLLLTRTAELRDRLETGSDYDPTRLEIFNNLFRHVAEEMGVQLCQTARSVNIKERLDFSCALFDRHGDLVANAPHMPVHLGSMSETVRSVLNSRRGHIRPGDAYLTNDPYNGGTHLPDLTVVSPFFDEGSTTPLFFVASRAHHAEIGGVSPGSMPALSKHVDEEGVLFDDFSLMEEGRFNETALKSRLLTASHPSRNADTNVADLKAQVAANQRGIVRLQEVVDKYGADTVEAYMRHVKANAAEAVRRALGNVSDGTFSLEMDTGQTIAVAVCIDHEQRSAVIDFDGTSPQAENNLNAPRAITTAAVLYVMRMLVDNDIPLNAGCLDPIEIRVPEGSILNPVYPAAVAGGNVETSQCVVDALLAALGIMAASQGTMNNLTFGDASNQYYETICGGSGAGPGFEGTSAVHTHMTNSRLTDPEILETRYPVLLEAFSIRTRIGGRRTMARGRRYHPPIAFSEVDEGLYPLKSTENEAVRFGWWGSGSLRYEPD